MTQNSPTDDGDEGVDRSQTNSGDTTTMSDSNSVTAVQEYKDLGPSERDLLKKPDLDEMSLEELQIEYRTLDRFELNAMKHEDYWERIHQIWRELRDRTDVQQPKCPECGARNWGQSPGDPIHCNGCGKEGVHDDDLREVIYDAWRQMIGMEEESA